MKKLLLILLCLPMLSVAQVTLDGFTYLENQTDHSGIKIIFERTAPSSSTDSVITDSSGAFTVQLDVGIYNVSYTKDGYFPETLIGQPCYVNTTLSDMTLIEHNTLINVPTLFSTIQTAINYAFDGDTILVHPGTYVENINYNGKNIIVGSLYLTTSDTSHISSTIIDGNQSGSVVTFENGEDSNVVLTGFTIINGDATVNYARGGGINCDNSSPRLENLLISGNSAQRGGGISCYWYSSPKIVNVEISGNSTHVSGSNSGGGGVYCRFYSNPEMVNVQINNNSSADFGGGILSSKSDPNLKNVTIYNNVSDMASGGLCISESDAVLKNVTICNNSSNNLNNMGGGGIYTGSSSNSSLTNVIFSGNVGLYGIRILGNPTILYSNFYNNGIVDINSAWIDVNITTNANGDSCDAYYNIQEDPLFTGLVNGDFHLSDSSPCIGAGTATGAPTTDIEGNPSPNPVGSNPDLGAYENFLAMPNILGCIDSLAFNYDASANTDDGSCIAVVNGCTDATACNYDASANTDDGSCILPDGCIDINAANYNASALCDDGSCAYSSPFIGLVLEEVDNTAASSTFVNGEKTYRLYAELSPGGSVFMIFGNEQYDHLIATSTTFYQDASGEDIQASINPSFFQFVPSLEFDSWVTIGDSYTDGPLDVGDLNWTDFNTTSSWSFGGDFDSDASLFRNALDPLIQPDVNGKVLLGQFTTSGVLSGHINLRLLSNGIEFIETNISIPQMAILGCTDATAFNYDASANTDDGSCI